MNVTELPLSPLSLASTPSLHDLVGSSQEEADALYCIAGVVDVDDFVISRVTHGQEWAKGVVGEIEALLARERERTAPSSGYYHLEPDEWVFILHGPDEEALRTLGIQLAENLCREVAAQTPVTATVSLGRVHDGEYRTERSVSEAVTANERKLILGGNRVILADDKPGFEPAATVAHANRAGARLPNPGGRPRRRARAPEELDRRVGRSRRRHAGGAPLVDRCCRPLLARRGGAAPPLRRVDGLGRDLWPARDDLRGADVDRDHPRAVVPRPLARAGPPVEHQKDREPKASKRHILALVETYLHEHYAENLSLAKVSRTLFVSSFYISHLFHRELNTTFLKYLTAIRMAKARQLLLETDAPITSIARQVGYTTPKNFRSVFKRAIGMTPTEFRRSSTRAA